MNDSIKTDFKGDLETAKEQLKRIESNLDYLSSLNEKMKDEGEITNPNLIRYIVDLVECDKYSMGKLVKPLLRAYRRAYERKKIVVRNYEILSK